MTSAKKEQLDFYLFMYPYRLFSFYFMSHFYIEFELWKQKIDQEL